MSRSTALPYQFAWSRSHPHIAWADLYSNGVLVEIAVVALDEKNGDLYFIPISALDSIDRERLVRIIGKRDAHKYPLWDLLSSSTLKNGMNALEYFNQLVKVRTVSGQFFAPGVGKVGGLGGQLSVRPQVSAPQPPPQALHEAVANASYPEVEPAAAAEPYHVKRGPGRPPSPRK